MIRATVGGAFRVDLDSTPVSGYRWRLRELPDGIELVDADFTPASNARLGAGGIQHFELRAAVAGRFSLTFTLERSWEATAVDSRVVDVEVS
ncbi:protease inhibitor I42 family protein [Rhodococcus spelaei]|uniref:protease inhibitor I42 family protein n=1 Tax=Rhodococcus spelaei TaxID=2546320 RepID=UPI0015EFBF0C|nr:protease inhibitor I42 family protein [Rhodococcus spelaei]